MSKERENKNFKQTLKEYLMYTCLTLIIRLYDVTSCSLEISNDTIKPLECFNSCQFHLLLQDERTHNASKSFSWLVYLEIRFYFQRASGNFFYAFQVMSGFIRNDCIRLFNGKVHSEFNHILSTWRKSGPNLLLSRFRLSQKTFKNNFLLQLKIWFSAFWNKLVLNILFLLFQNLYLVCLVDIFPNDEGFFQGS